MTKQIPELLAPAGDMAAFDAALACGADAIYVGGKSFSARAQAGNFSNEELAAAVRRAHFHGVKVYCAVNTLISDEELPGALEYIGFLYGIGIDAVIVQDYGLLCAIRRLFPALPVNASTQMTVHNTDALRFVERQGVKRTILARELSLQDITALSQAAEGETEVFVHGALCVCYSGQCLMSSMIGGRSGNRGRCAQPCRMPYQLINGKGEAEKSVSGEYLLSPKDTFGITAIDGLLETGVASLKIEGRMKRPEYVAVVTDNYRRLLDNRAGKNGEFDYDASLAELKQIFNRDFGAAYMLGNPGGELCSGKKPNNRGVFLGRVEGCSNGRLRVKLELELRSGDGLEIWVTKGGRTGFLAEDMRQNGEPVSFAAAGESVELNFAGRAYKGDRIFKTNDSRLMQKALDSCRRERTQALSLRLFARLGQYASLQARDADGNIAFAEDESYVVAEAQKRPADREYLLSQLGRLGGSGFRLEELDADIDANIMLPASVLNNLRRSVCEKLRALREAKHYPALPERNMKQELKKLCSASAPARHELRISAWVNDSAAALRAAENGADIIYFDEGGMLSADDAALQKLCSGLAARGVELCPVLPQIYLQAERGVWQQRMHKYRELGISSLRCDSLGAIELARASGFEGRLCGGTGLNIFNSVSAASFAEEGLSRELFSQELSLEQIRSLRFLGEKEVLAHGAAQLMVSQYCLIGGTKGGRTLKNACSRPCRGDSFRLRDQKGYLFPIRCDRFCRMHIFNARELCMLNDLPALRAAGVDIIMLDLRLYDAAQAGRICRAYREVIGGADAEELAERLPRLEDSGFTKGHFYRGVCDGC